ncbi:uncharacterized protein JCM15063_006187 [Sporobolomyces koalae]|uniref:uncharacterized protein n=1 Tax=Sporobolomyces koalae TaxID=500713 RepID=UPI0031706054
MSTIEQVSSRVPTGSAASRFSVGNVAWWILSKIPWWCYAVALVAAWLRFGSGQSQAKKVARSARKRTQQSLANQNTPRRASATGVRTASGRSTPQPQLSRQSSFNGVPEMRERRSSFRSESPFRPAASPAPSLNQHRSSQPSRPSSSLRYSALAPSQPLPAKPQQPSQSSLAVKSSVQSKKRSHDIESPPTEGGPKRGKFDSFHSSSEDDGELEQMDVDDQHDSSSGTEKYTGGEEARPKPSKKDSNQASLHSRDEREDRNQKKRSLRDSPSLTDGEGEDPKLHRRISKKAKKQAIGTGSVRDKRGIDEVASGDEPEEASGSEAGTKRERNADSEVESQDEEEPTPEPQEAKPARKSIVAKRFREKAKREGSDDEDLMGDDDLLSPPPPGPASKRVGSNSTPKKRLSSRSAQSARKLKSTFSKLNTPRRPLNKPSSSSSSKAGIENADEHERRAGEVWQNHEGDYYRLDEPDLDKGEKVEDGLVQRRLVECREKRRKYKLPKDVRHPDTKEMHEVVVERWVTQEEYKALFEQRKLAWQMSYEEEEREKERARLEEAQTPQTGDQSMEDVTSPPRQPKELGLYYTKGTNSPLRTHSMVSNRLLSSSASTSSLSSLVAASPKLASSASHGSLAALSKTGRLRLPSAQGIQSPARRAWSIAERARLKALSQEQAEAEEKERDNLEKEEQGQKKIKLGDYATATTPAAAPALAIEAAKTESKPMALSGLFGATPSASKPAKEEKTNAPAFSFGSTSADAPAAAASTEKKASAVPSLTFGASVALPASKKQEEPTPTLSFGSTPAASTTAPATSTPASSSFSFGAPAAPAKEEESTKPTSTGFSFGSTPAAPEKKDSAPSFSFGSGPPPAAPSTTTEASKSLGSLFGGAASTPAVEKKPEPVETPFSFGSTPASATTEPKKDAIATGFSFGASPAPTLDSKPQESKPAASFSFGSSATAAPPVAPASTPSFSFGSSAPAASASPSLFGATTAPPASTSSFSFGAPAPAASTPAPAPGSLSAAAPSNTFSFGAAPAAPASTGFSFGAPSTAPAATPTAGSGFSFGSNLSTGNVTPGLSTTGGFSFGGGGQSSSGSLTPTTPGGGLFSLGSGGEDASASGTTTPRRRTIRKMPGR